MDRLLRLGLPWGLLWGLLVWAVGACDDQAGTTPPAVSAPPVKTTNPAIVDGRIRWVTYTPAALEKARAAGKAVFVRIDADWDINSKTYEVKELETETVREALNRTGAVPMRADFTDEDEVVEKLMVSTGRSGVPVYVIFPPKGKMRVLELPITKDEVAKALIAAGKPSSGADVSPKR